MLGAILIPYYLQACMAPAKADAPVCAVIQVLPGAKGAELVWCRDDHLCWKSTDGRMTNAIIIKDPPV